MEDRERPPPAGGPNAATARGSGMEREKGWEEKRARERCAERGRDKGMGRERVALLVIAKRASIYYPCFNSARACH